MTSLAALLAGGLAGFIGGNSIHQVAPSPPAQPHLAATDPPRVPGAGDDPSTEISSLIRVERDPWGALAELQRRVGATSWQFHYEECGNLFQAWAWRDLDGAIEGLAALDPGSVYPALRAVLDVAFERDPALGFELMKQWKQYRVLPRWLTEHPAEACRELPEFVATQDGADHFSFPRAWVKTDPAAALEWARSLKGPHRRWMVDETIQAWVTHDIEGAIGAYTEGRDELDWRSRKQFETKIPRELGRKDPTRALEWLAGTDLSPGDRQDARLRIVRSWSTSDLEAAIEWTRQQSPVGRKQALSQISHAWVEHDVEAAAQFYLEVGPRSQSDRQAAETIGLAFVKHDPAAALDWVDQLPQGVRAATEGRMMRELLKVDRGSALAEFDRRLPRLSVATVEVFAEAFVGSDLAAARIWLGALPSGPARDLAIRGAQKAALAGDSEEHRAFARDLEAGAP